MDALSKIPAVNVSRIRIKRLIITVSCASSFFFPAGIMFLNLSAFTCNFIENRLNELCQLGLKYNDKSDQYNENQYDFHHSNSTFIFQTFFYPVPNSSCIHL